MWDSGLDSDYWGFSLVFWRADAQAFCHLLVEEAFSDAVRLHPLSVNDELRNRTLAGALDNLLGRAGSGFNVNFSEREIVLRKKAFGDAAVRAPES